MLRHESLSPVSNLSLVSNKMQHTAWLRQATAHAVNLVGDKQVTEKTTSSSFVTEITLYILKTAKLRL